LLHTFTLFTFTLYFCLLVTHLLVGLRYYIPTLFLVSPYIALFILFTLVYTHLHGWLHLLHTVVTYIYVRCCYVTLVTVTLLFGYLRCSRLLLLFTVVTLRLLCHLRCPFVTYIWLICWFLLICVAFCVYITFIYIDWICCAVVVVVVRCSCTLRYVLRLHSRCCCCCRLFVGYGYVVFCTPLLLLFNLPLLFTVGSHVAVTTRCRVGLPGWLFAFVCALWLHLFVWLRFTFTLPGCCWFVTLFWLIVYRLLRSRLYLCYVVVVAVTLFVTLRVPGYARSPRFGYLVIVGWLLPCYGCCSCCWLLRLRLVLYLHVYVLFTLRLPDVTLVTFVTLRCRLFGLHTRTHCCWILRWFTFFAVVGCTLFPHVAVCYATFIAVTGLIWLLPLIYGFAPHVYFVVTLRLFGWLLLIAGYDVIYARLRCYGWLLPLLLLWFGCTYGYVVTFGWFDGYYVTHLCVGYLCSLRWLIYVALHVLCLIWICRFPLLFTPLVVRCCCYGCYLVTFTFPLLLVGYLHTFTDVTTFCCCYVPVVPGLRLLRCWLRFLRCWLLRLRLYVAVYVVYLVVYLVDVVRLLHLHTFAVVVDPRWLRYARCRTFTRCRYITFTLYVRCPLVTFVTFHVYIWFTVGYVAFPDSCPLCPDFGCCYVYRYVLPRITFVWFVVTVVVDCWILLRLDCCTRWVVVVRFIYVLRLLYVTTVYTVGWLFVHIDSPRSPFPSCVHGCHCPHFTVWLVCYTHVVVTLPRLPGSDQLPGLLRCYTLHVYVGCCVALPLRLLHTVGSFGYLPRPRLRLFYGYGFPGCWLRLRVRGCTRTLLRLRYLRLPRLVVTDYCPRLVVHLHCGYIYVALHFAVRYICCLRLRVAFWLFPFGLLWFIRCWLLVWFTLRWVVPLPVGCRWLDIYYGYVYVGYVVGCCCSPLFCPVDYVDLVTFLRWLLPCTGCRALPVVGWICWLRRLFPLYVCTFTHFTFTLPLFPHVCYFWLRCHTFAVTFLYSYVCCAVYITFILRCWLFTLLPFTFAVALCRYVWLPVYYAFIYVTDYGLHLLYVTVTRVVTFILDCDCVYAFYRTLLRLLLLVIYVTLRYVVARLRCCCHVTLPVVVVTFVTLYTDYYTHTFYVYIAFVVGSHLFGWFIPCRLLFPVAVVVCTFGYSLLQFTVDLRYLGLFTLDVPLVYIVILFTLLLLVICGLRPLVMPVTFPTFLPFDLYLLLRLHLPVVWFGCYVYVYLRLRCYLHWLLDLRLRSRCWLRCWFAVVVTHLVVVGCCYVVTLVVVVTLPLLLLLPVVALLLLLLRYGCCWLLVPVVTYVRFGYIVVAFLRCCCWFGFTLHLRCLLPRCYALCVVPTFGCYVALLFIYTTFTVYHTLCRVTLRLRLLVTFLHLVPTVAGCVIWITPAVAVILYVYGYVRYGYGCLPVILRWLVTVTVDLRLVCCYLHYVTFTHGCCFAWLRCCVAVTVCCRSHGCCSRLHCTFTFGYLRWLLLVVVDPRLVYGFVTVAHLWFYTLVGWLLFLYIYIYLVVVTLPVGLLFDVTTRWFVVRYGYGFVGCWLFITLVTFTVLTFTLPRCLHTRVTFTFTLHARLFYTVVYYGYHTFTRCCLRVIPHAHTVACFGYYTLPTGCWFGYYTFTFTVTLYGYLRWFHLLLTFVVCYICWLHLLSYICYILRTLYVRFTLRCGWFILGYFICSRCVTLRTVVTICVRYVGWLLVVTRLFWVITFTLFGCYVWHRLLPIWLVIWLLHTAVTFYVWYTLFVTVVTLHVTLPRCYRLHCTVGCYVAHAGCFTTVCCTRLFTCCYVVTRVYVSVYGYTVVVRCCPVTGCCYYIPRVFVTFTLFTARGCVRLRLCVYVTRCCCTFTRCVTVVTVYVGLRLRCYVHTRWLHYVYVYGCHVLRYTLGCYAVDFGLRCTLRWVGCVCLRCCYGWLPLLLRRFVGYVYVAYAYTRFTFLRLFTRSVYTFTLPFVYTFTYTVGLHVLRFTFCGSHLFTVTVRTFPRYGYIWLLLLLLLLFVGCYTFTFDVGLPVVVAVGYLRFAVTVVPHGCCRCWFTTVGLPRRYTFTRTFTFVHLHVVHTRLRYGWVTTRLYTLRFPTFTLRYVTRLRYTFWLYVYVYVTLFDFVVICTLLRLFVVCCFVYLFGCVYAVGRRIYVCYYVTYTHVTLCRLVVRLTLRYIYVRLVYVAVVTRLHVCTRYPLLHHRLVVTLPLRLPRLRYRLFLRVVVYIHCYHVVVLPLPGLRLPHTRILVTFTFVWTFGCVLRLFFTLLDAFAVYHTFTFTFCGTHVTLGLLRTHTLRLRTLHTVRLRFGLHVWRLHTFTHVWVGSLFYVRCWVTFTLLVTRGYGWFIHTLLLHILRVRLHGLHGYVVVYVWLLRWLRTLPVGYVAVLPLPHARLHILRLFTRYVVRCYVTRLIYVVTWLRCYICLPFYAHFTLHLRLRFALLLRFTLRCVTYVHTVTHVYVYHVWLLLHRYVCYTRFTTFYTLTLPVTVVYHTRLVTRWLHLLYVYVTVVYDTLPFGWLLVGLPLFTLLFHLYVTFGCWFTYVVLWLLFGCWVYFITHCTFGLRGCCYIYTFTLPIYVSLLRCLPHCCCICGYITLWFYLTTLLLRYPVYICCISLFTLFVVLRLLFVYIRCLRHTYTLRFGYHTLPLHFTVTLLLRLFTVRLLLRFVVCVAFAFTHAWLRVLRLLLLRLRFTFVLLVRLRYVGCCYYGWLHYGCYVCCWFTLLRVYICSHVVYGCLRLRWLVTVVVGCYAPFLTHFTLRLIYGYHVTHTICTVTFVGCSWLRYPVDTFVVGCYHTLRLRCWLFPDVWVAFTFTFGCLRCYRCVYLTFVVVTVGSRCVFGYVWLLPLRYTFWLYVYGWTPFVVGLHCYTVYLRVYHTHVVVVTVVWYVHWLRYRSRLLYVLHRLVVAFCLRFTLFTLLRYTFTFVARYICTHTRLRVHVRFCTRFTVTFYGCCHGYDTRIYTTVLRYVALVAVDIARLVTQVTLLRCYVTLHCPHHAVVARYRYTLPRWTFGLPLPRYRYAFVTHVHVRHTPLRTCGCCLRLVCTARVPVVYICTVVHVAVIYILPVHYHICIYLFTLHVACHNVLVGSRLVTLHVGWFSYLHVTLLHLVTLVVAFTHCLIYCTLLPGWFSRFITFVIHCYIYSLFGLTLLHLHFVVVVIYFIGSVIYGLFTLPLLTVGCLTQFTGSHAHVCCTVPAHGYTLPAFPRYVLPLFVHTYRYLPTVFRYCYISVLLRWHLHGYFPLPRSVVATFALRTFGLRLRLRVLHVYVSRLRWVPFVIYVTHYVYVVTFTHTHTHAFPRLLLLPLSAFIYVCVTLRYGWLFVGYTFGWFTHGYHIALLFILLGCLFYTFPLQLLGSYVWFTFCCLWFTFVPHFTHSCGSRFPVVLPFYAHTRLRLFAVCVYVCVYTFTFTLLVVTVPVYHTFYGLRVGCCICGWFPLIYCSRLRCTFIRTPRFTVTYTVVTRLGWFTRLLRSFVYVAVPIYALPDVHCAFATPAVGFTFFVAAFRVTHTFTFVTFVTHVVQHVVPYGCSVTPHVVYAHVCTPRYVLLHVLPFYVSHLPHAFVTVATRLLFAVTLRTVAVGCAGCTHALPRLPFVTVTFTVTFVTRVWLRLPYRHCVCGWLYGLRCTLRLRFTFALRTTFTRLGLPFTLLRCTHLHLLVVGYGYTRLFYTRLLLLHLLPHTVGCYIWFTVYVYTFVTVIWFVG